MIAFPPPVVYTPELKVALMRARGNVRLVEWVLEYGFFQCEAKDVQDTRTEVAA